MDINEFVKEMVTGCNHLMLPISWRKSTHMDEATEFMCQKCMITVKKCDVDQINDAYVTMGAK